MESVRDLEVRGVRGWRFESEKLENSDEGGARTYIYDVDILQHSLDFQSLLSPSTVVWKTLVLLYLLFERL